MICHMGLCTKLYLAELLREIDLADLTTQPLGCHGLSFSWSEGSHNVL